MAWQDDFQMKRGPGGEYEMPQFKLPKIKLPKIKFPPPIERVYTPKVTEVKRTEVGFRIEDPGPPARYRDALEESLMLTGDENIIDLDVVAQYKIIDPVKYLFNVRGPAATVKAAAEAAIREITGTGRPDDTLPADKPGRPAPATPSCSRILDRYDS